MYSAAVRTFKGAWQLRQTGKTAREAKRKLAKEVGLSVRQADSLPLGKSPFPIGDSIYHQVEVRQG